MPISCIGWARTAWRSRTWARPAIIIEKPFGHDLESARELNDDVNTVFSENQIFRIDHYLGKETVQNILVFRFANGIFEPIWNRNYIDHVQITAAESIGIEGRGPFYEKAGALRDVMQNHVMELLSFVTMEPPASFAAEAVRREKIKVWTLHQADPHPGLRARPVRSRHRRRRDGQGLSRGRPRRSEIADGNLRCAAAGDRQLALGGRALLPARGQTPGQPGHRDHDSVQATADVTVRHRRHGPCTEIQPNIITMRIQPDEGISLRFGAKLPGPQMDVCPVIMDFSYAQAFGSSSANGYERLLLDAMLGDATLFAHRDGVEATWALFTPVLDAWARNSRRLPQLRGRHLGSGLRR